MMAKWGGTGHPHRVGGELPQCLSSHFAEVKTPGSFWLKVWFHCTHAKEGKSQHLLLKDPRLRGRDSELGEGQFCLGAWVSRRQRAGQQASIAYKTVRAKVTNFFQAQLLSGYFKRSPSKSKTGTWGRNPKLGSLSKCPDSGCEQSCHTIKCLGSS